MTPDLLLLSGSSSVRTPAGLNHAVYAARHGLRYVFDATPAPVSNIYLVKIASIRRHLATADWVFWVDDDAFFTRLDEDLRGLLPDDAGTDLVFCGSPVNPEGGWTWMSAGQLLVRNTPSMHRLLDAVLATDLATVRAWWDEERLGLFTRGDQDALVHQLLRDGSEWAGAYRRDGWERFNSRPYHYRDRLDEHFVCHFAVPGGRPKLELVREFAERMGTTTALVPAEAIAPYRTFAARSEMGPMLGAGVVGAVAARRQPRGAPGRVAALALRLPRRAARIARRVAARVAGGG